MNDERAKVATTTAAVNMVLDMILDELEGRKRNKIMIVVCLLAIAALFALLAYYHPLFTFFVMLLIGLFVGFIIKALYTCSFTSRAVLAAFITGIAPTAAVRISASLLLLIRKMKLNNHWLRFQMFLVSILFIGRRMGVFQYEWEVNE